MRDFLQKWILRFTSFMSGRNGLDKLNIFILLIYVIIYCITSFFSKKWVTLFALIPLGFFAFRFLSKNIFKRQQENSRFEVFANKAEKKIKLFGDRIKYRKTNVFRKCPACKTVLKLPKIKGNHNARCNCCGNQFNVRIIF